MDSADARCAAGIRHFGGECVPESIFMSPRPIIAATTPHTGGEDRRDEIGMVWLILSLRMAFSIVLACALLHSGIGMAKPPPSAYGGHRAATTARRARSSPASPRRGMAANVYRHHGSRGGSTGRRAWRRRSLKVSKRRIPRSPPILQEETRRAISGSYLSVL